MIELVVSISASVIITGTAAMLLWNAARLQSQASARIELGDIAARACEQTLRYLREIPQDAGLTGEAQISLAAADDIRFGVYGFRLNGSQLEITTDTATNWYPMAGDVSSLTFAYYNNTGSTLASFPLSQADRESVRLIQMSLTLARAGETAPIQSSIYLRSFMNEMANAP